VKEGVCVGYIGEIAIVCYSRRGNQVDSEEEERVEERRAVSVSVDGKVPRLDG
jgi:hypothetical protein